jgi:phospholipase C
MPPLIGPRAKRGHVHTGLLEPNAILNFFSWRFGLPPIGSRSQFSGNLAHALDFDNPPRLDARGYSVPVGEFGLDCQRFSSLPQVPNPLPIGGGITLPIDLHAQQMRGLYEKSRARGFWTGPVAFPPL